MFILRVEMTRKRYGNDTEMTRTEDGIDTETTRSEDGIDTENETEYVNEMLSIYRWKMNSGWKGHGICK